MRRRSSQVALSAAFVTLAATVAACGSEQESKYCGDETATVVPASECETNADGSFIYIGNYGSTYGTGDKLPKSETNHKVRSTDSSGRGKLGLPKSGGFGGNGSKFAGATSGG